MKAGLTTSVVLHTALLAFGLLTITAPKPFDVVEESISVSTVTEAELAQMVKGDKKAPARDKPAPRPTKRPDTVKDAQNAGDNTVDLENAPTPEPAPRKIEASSAPKAEPDPAPVPEPAAKPLPKAKSEPAPVPATEAKVEPAPRQPVKPDPVKEAIQREVVKPDPVQDVIEKAPAESETAIVLPDTAPIPERRPEPPAPPAPAQTAKAPERQDSDKPAEKDKAVKTAADTPALEDEIKALLNKDKPAGSGAQKQVEEAAAGNSRTNAPKLTRAEMDVLREQIGGCWSIDAGISDPDKLKVSVKFNVSKDGKLDGLPTVIKSSGNSQFDSSAVRAIQKCDMRGLNLPAGKHETWNEVIVNFDPTDMFF